MKFINNKYNILILPCSTQIGIEQFLSLQYNKHFILYGASHNVNDENFHNFISLKNKKESIDFISEISDIVKTLNIDIILTSHDEVNYILKNSILKDKIIGSSQETINLCRFKSKTYEKILTNEKLKKYVPLYEKVTDKKFSKYEFLKPDNGQGSRGAFKYFKECSIPENYISCEYLPGIEYTVDCFSDKNNKLLYSQARVRSVISNGISEETKLINDDELKLIAEELNLIFSFNGSWFFQMKKDINDQVKFLEVAPRIAGASIINRLNGVNFTALSLYQHLNYNIEILNQNLITENIRKNSKIKLNFEKIYVDYDDTFYFIENELEKFKHKEILIITRSKEKIESKYPIIRVKDNELKSFYIEKNSIFIDDSYRERLDVIKNCNTPSFSPEEFMYIEEKK
jgi:hypothetical protein